MKRTILLVLLSVTSALSYEQMQQGTNFISVNVNTLFFVRGYEKALVYDRDPLTNGDGDTIPLLVPPNGGFRYQYACTPKLSTGVFLVPFKTYFAGGLYGRHYFDLSRRRDYPAFFLHVGASFHSRTDDLGRANYGGAEVLIGQTFRRTREPLTYREITQDIGGFLRSGKWPRNGYRGRWGLEYSMGASISYGPASRKSVVSPQLQIGVSYYFDSKGWTRRP